VNRPETVAETIREVLANRRRQLSIED